MTYTKKRIVIDAEVPEGATHYGTWHDGTIMIDDDGNMCWWKIDADIWKVWREGFNESDPSIWRPCIAKDWTRVKPIQEVTE